MAEPANLFPLTSRFPPSSPSIERRSSRPTSVATKTCQSFLSRHGRATGVCRAAWRPGLRRYRGAAHPGGRQNLSASATRHPGFCCRSATGLPDSSPVAGIRLWTEALAIAVSLSKKGTGGLAPCSSEWTLHLPCFFTLSTEGFLPS